MEEKLISSYICRFPCSYETARNTRSCCFKNNLHCLKNLLRRSKETLKNFRSDNFCRAYYKSFLAGVDTGSFRHRYTDFGHTNLGVLKFNPYLKIKVTNKHNSSLLIKSVNNINIITRK